MLRTCSRYNNVLIDMKREEKNRKKKSYTIILKQKRRNDDIQIGGNKLKTQKVKNRKIREMLS